MPQSLAQVYIPGVFSTKNRDRLITKEIQPELFAYMGAIIKKDGNVPVLFGGVEDHVHLLYGMSRTVSIAKTIENVKTASSKWAKDRLNPNFSWQTGYGAFGVSHRELDSVIAYIANQESHHQQTSFQDEYRGLLREHGIDFNELYVWD